MRSVRWRWAQTTILTALTFLVLGAVFGFGTAATKSDDPTRGAAPGYPSTLYVTVAPAPTGPPRPAGFLGLSFEYTALEAYTGADPAALDPVFVQLLRNLGQPSGAPILRIGGNSTDATWWPIRGMSRPRGITYALTPGWLAGTHALTAALGAKLILGVNLAAAQPRLSGAEATALLRGLGAANVAALEFGNEPDVYGVFPWYREHGRPVFARGPGYGLTTFLGDVRRTLPSIPPVALAGPATAELSWLAGIPALLAGEPGLGVVTVHRYPLQGCLKNRQSPSYPSVANLLDDRSSAGLAQALTPYVSLAHAHSLQFRVDELNSAALAHCLGRTGVSDTFASALWMLDTLFNLASAGVDGVNIHSLPGAAYELFTFSRGVGGWHAFVHPDYYGMLLFAQAFPAGAQLMSVRARSGPVKVWATRDPVGRTRALLINKDSRPHRVELQLPPSLGQAELEWLRAPGVGATSGVTLGGQTFGLQTSTGALAAPQLQPVSEMLGWYSVQVPAYSAALLTR